MSKIKKHPTLQEYDNGWEGRDEIVNIGLLELGEMINQKLENRPFDRDRDFLRNWRKELNGMIESYNSRAGWKCYNHVY